MKEYYNQADNRWANHLYTSPTHPQANLKTSGCGPTSAAMIVTNMVKKILPNEWRIYLKIMDIEQMREQVWKHLIG